MAPGRCSTSGRARGLWCADWPNCRAAWTPWTFPDLCSTWPDRCPRETTQKYGGSGRPPRTAPLDPPYGLVTAGSSLDWMDWYVVLPRVGAALGDGCYLALFDQQADPLPWDDARCARSSRAIRPTANSAPARWWTSSRHATSSDPWVASAPERWCSRRGSTTTSSRCTGETGSPATVWHRQPLPSSTERCGRSSSPFAPAELSQCTCSQRWSSAYRHRDGISRKLLTTPFGTPRTLDGRPAGHRQDDARPADPRHPAVAIAEGVVGDDADLLGAGIIAQRRCAEALQYRLLDRKF